MKEFDVNSNKPKRESDINNFGEYLFYAYANLNMLHHALRYGLKKYNKLSYMIRAKAFKAYKNGSWQIHDLMVNNIAKMKSDNTHCWYCGKGVSSPKELTIDHIFPRSKGGMNEADNIFFVCKECNSSKNKTDLLQWYFSKFHKWPSVFILQHYLKQIYFYALDNDLLNKTMAEIEEMELPFNYEYTLKSTDFTMRQTKWRFICGLCLSNKNIRGRAINFRQRSENAPQTPK